MTERLKGVEREAIFSQYIERQPEIQGIKEVKKAKTDRRAYFKEYNDSKKAERKEARLRKQNERGKETAEATAKYYEAEAIKVLISFKKYTELNKEKRQLWLDFNWTFKDCKESFSEGYADIVAVMKLAQVADSLIKDFWETAKNEERQKGKSWNVLSEEEKDRLIKYWGRKKANVENGYIDEDERLEKQGDSYLKEIERAKFHEQRGKIKCPCGWCEQEQIIKGEVKAQIRKDQKKIEKEFDDYWGATDDDGKGECYQCGKIKKLSEDGACKKCSDYL